MTDYQVYEGSVHSKGTDTSRNSDYANGYAFKTGCVKKWWLVRLTLVFLLYFPFLALQVQDSSPLRVVETG